MASTIRVKRYAAGTALFGLVLGVLTCAASAGLRGQDIEIAEELFVDLNASDPTAGSEIWESQGTIINFHEVGDPVVVDREGAPGPRGIPADRCGGPPRGASRRCGRAPPR